MTAERFIDSPFGTDGDKLYKTGDLVRYHDDGVIEFLGRNDSQVKLRGLRIELGDIESHLMAAEEVKDAVVAVKHCGDNDERLIAYFTAVAGEPIEPALLRNHLMDVVPAYMVPQIFCQLDQLPLTTSGNVNFLAGLWNRRSGGTKSSGALAGARRAPCTLGGTPNSTGWSR